MQATAQFIPLHGSVLCLPMRLCKRIIAIAASRFTAGSYDPFTYSAGTRPAAVRLPFILF